MTNPLRDLREVAVIDCETTGLDPEEDRIIRLAVVLVDLSEPVAKATTLEATLSAGFEEVAEQLWDFIGDRPLLGFNIEFDRQFLNAELRRHGFKMFHRKRSHCVQQALLHIWGYSPSLANAAARMQLTDFIGAERDPLQAALATATIAGMLKRLSRREVANAPGDVWTANPRAQDDDEAPAGCLTVLATVVSLILAAGSRP